MNTNHKPATALPWIVDETDAEGCTVSTYEENRCIAEFHPDYSTLTGGGAKDTAYCAHTANAYPELVEALKELVARCDGAEGVRADGSNIQTHNAHGILTKLGEA